MKKFLAAHSKVFAMVLANILIIVFGLFMVASYILKNSAGNINSSLGLTKQEILPGDTDPDADLQYYKSDFNSVNEVKINGEKLNRDIVAEGSTLLKNENNALPLAKGSKVSLFSTSSVDLVYSGTGSSGTNTSGSVDLKTGLEENGKLSVNTALWDWYRSNLSIYGRNVSSGGTIGATFRVGDASWDEINTDSKTNRSYGDAAIFVLSRRGGEGADLTISGGAASDMTNGNYLELSPKEISVLKALKQEKAKGTFSRIIVIMNSANQVQCDFADNADYGIDALIWCGSLGAVGVYAVGDLLVGEVNFSGKLSDVFWSKHYYNPVYANWGQHTYSGTQMPGGGKHNTYAVYQENIYNGYYYTETRYEDVVMGADKVGAFDWSGAVSYPFGYGLSYTSFTYSGLDVFYRASEDAYNVSVTVTNSGKVRSGKEAVQIYLQKPYTEYDKTNNIEKAAVELVGFDKTKELNPGQPETLTVKIPRKYFASYDADNAKTYILDAGKYYLTAAKDSHTAVNNILALKGKTTAGGMTENGDKNLVYETAVNKLDTVTYSKSTVTGNEIKNQFENADLNKYKNAGTNRTAYVTRKNWTETVKLGYTENYTKTNNHEVLTTTEGMRADMQQPAVERDDIEYPTYGSTETSYTLADLRAFEDGTPIKYDNPLWQDLLDQLTWKETCSLLTNGFRKTWAVPSVGKIETIDHNGATGVVESYSNNYDIKKKEGINRGLAVANQDPDWEEKPTLYPCNGLVASTYNKELAAEYGRAWGEDCLWAGYSGLYGTGINTHRGAYCGRAFEYYSEDPVLGGQIVAALTKGMKEKGVYQYLKHCFLNDQELNREGISTWANEQTIREIYLRPFQIAIEEGGAENVMTGFNRLGVIWTGHQGFVNTVLRAEFGMTGFAVTDYWQGYMTVLSAILNGNDLPDADLGDGGNNPFRNNGYSDGYGKLAWAMRESAHRIFYTVAQSNAMNGISPGTKIILIYPDWPDVLSAMEIVLGITCGFSVVLLAVVLTVPIIRRNYYGEKNKT